MSRLRTLGGTVRSLDMRSARPAPKTKEEFYRSAEFMAWRTAVIKRDGGKCRQCGTSSGRLVADHIREIRDGGSRLAPENGQCLCLPCHNAKSAKAKSERLRE